uniref:Uncharacterized protein n=1 Tax=viral metagenome TaxID=1070528 RepID=A0A6C0AEH7_9ZZZZ
MFIIIKYILIKYLYLEIFGNFYKKRTVIKSLFFLYFLYFLYYFFLLHSIFFKKYF